MPCKQPSSLARSSLRSHCSFVTCISGAAHEIMPALRPHDVDRVRARLGPIALPGHGAWRHPPAPPRPSASTILREGSASRRRESVCGLRPCTRRVAHHTARRAYCTPASAAMRGPSASRRREARDWMRRAMLGGGVTVTPTRAPRSGSESVPQSAGCSYEHERSICRLVDVPARAWPSRERACGPFLDKQLD